MINNDYIKYDYKKLILSHMKYAINEFIHEENQNIHIRSNNYDPKQIE